MSRESMPSTEIFESVGAWGDHAATAPRTSNANDKSQSIGQATTWCDNTSLDSAVTLAQSGGYWAEGAALMRKSIAIAETFTARVPLPRIHRAVTGGAPCVGAYCMGHPKSMFNREKSLSAGKPVLYVGVVMGMWFNSTADQKFNRGGAIMAAINELEAQGYRCEIIAVCRVPDSPKDKLSTWSNTEIRVKRAEERYNPASVAFMMAHPAAHRRVQFRVMESSPIGSKLTEKAYGYAGDMPKLYDSLTQDFDIWFEGLTPSVCYECSTPDSAFEYVRKQVENQLSRMAHGAGQK